VHRHIAPESASRSIANCMFHNRSWDAITFIPGLFEPETKLGIDMVDESRAAGEVKNEPISRTKKTLAPSSRAKAKPKSPKRPKKA